MKRNFQIVFEISWEVGIEIQTLYSLIGGEFLPQSGEVVYAVEAGSPDYPRAVKAALEILATRRWEYTLFPETKTLRLYSAELGLSETQYKTILDMSSVDEVAYFLIGQVVGERQVSKAESFLAGSLWDDDDE